MPQKMENSGNEAKKYLKTKHITFLSAANYARFAHQLAANGRRKEQKTASFAQTNRNDQALRPHRASDRGSARQALGWPWPDTLMASGLVFDANEFKPGKEPPFCVASN
jgi:hypothetical protein